MNVRRLARARRWIRRAIALASRALPLLALHCNSSTNASPDAGDNCLTDQNGVSGGDETFFVTVTDTGFFVGGPNSGSTQSNLTIENASNVTLTLMNAGTKPHDLVVQCQATPNTVGCPMQACFPSSANIPTLQPGQSATTTFTAPFQEGPYLFTSDVAGDTQTDADGGVTGLVGEFVLM